MGKIGRDTAPCWCECGKTPPPPAPSAQRPPSSSSSSASSLHTHAQQRLSGPCPPPPSSPHSPNPEHCSLSLPVLLAVNRQPCLSQDLCTGSFQQLALSLGSWHGWLLLVLLLVRCLILLEAFLDHPLSSLSHSISCCLIFPLVSGLKLFY